jgi:hypothetical protein
MTSVASCCWDMTAWHGSAARLCRCPHRIRKYCRIRVPVSVFTKQTGGMEWEGSWRGSSFTGNFKAAAVVLTISDVVNRRVLWEFSLLNSRCLQMQCALTYVFLIAYADTVFWFLITASFSFIHNVFFIAFSINPFLRQYFSAIVFT